MNDWETTDQADKDAIAYVIRFGGMCRDCADTRVRGICDNSGMPCNSDVCRKVIAHALNAWRYGIKHGFIGFSSRGVENGS